jgi:hypothetical protein
MTNRTLSGNALKIRPCHQHWPDTVPLDTVPAMLLKLRRFKNQQWDAFVGA